MPHPHRTLLLSLPLLYAANAFAQDAPMLLRDCATITDDAARLACFDKLAATPAPRTEAAVVVNPADGGPAATVAVVTAQPSAESSARFSQLDHWELDEPYQRGVFKFRPHHSSYLIGTRTYRPNEQPYRPFLDQADDARLSKAELAFQLSFKMKMLQGAFGKPVDVWFGYTQNSFWQAANSKASSPFRETNYQPEVMAITPIGVELGGVQLRYVGLGLNHQSNGQSGTLSRSWNRLYAQVGVEKGGLSATARVWKRLNESDDDNPDIVDYMGRGDLALAYRRDGHIYSSTLRYNFHTNRGAILAGWAFPLAGNLKGYAQGFAGYGQSLIDYNYFQRSIGLGVLGLF
ncbi:phospholipase A [Massilia sp. GCM10023247]|uniref:phospholipase A n=1 Tax=Massilia sp. GCM10023247 TaxID=3252643 RepID=UPI003606824C